LHKHITKQRGALFARAKFDLLKRDSSCLLQAFRQLILQLLVQEPLLWRVKLLRSLGTQGAVICEFIPELTRLIGPQPPVVKLTTAEAANRFNSVWLLFISALTSPKAPLTLFVDDLQWADSGSLALIQLMFQQEHSHMLIIGA
jgi:predicted ATPase